jgi:glycerol kinase
MSIVKEKYVAAFDSGTTSCRTILFDRGGDIVSVSSQEFPQIYPKPGWVEHNPMDILDAQLATAKQALSQANASPLELAAIGITNQRETTVVWDRASGKPIMNALVWQDRRSAGICDDLKARGLSEYVKANTGLVIDAYFSGTKIRWMLDNIPGARKKAEKGELLFGTVDTWLIWNLTRGKVHVTDFSNASRTMLFNIQTLKWDDRLLKELDIPRAMLPQLRPSSAVFGTLAESILGGAKTPIASSIGDQQGALFGQTCFKAGMVKATYGTGGSLQMNTGFKPIRSELGLLTTIAWGLNDKVEYALEGLQYVAGASVQWLRDELKIIDESADSEYFASKVSDTNGVYFVPAFVGLSAPYWDQYARGAILGLTRGANRYHIIRATLESMAYQMKDVIDCMEKDSGIPNRELKVDGGACRNNFLMQFQADLLGVPVSRPKVIESTARGASFLAGLATGFWRDQSELLDSFKLDRKFEPSIDEARRNKLYAGWKKAVERARDWEEH